jgi:hypothetical protein
MTDFSPDPRTAVLPNVHPSRRRVADAVVACVLVFIQPVLLSAAFMFLGLMVMGTDACAYQACGDPVWLNRALWVYGVGGAALFVVTAAMTLFQIVHHRVAWPVPVVGYVATFVLGLGCWAMEMQAGPLGR